MNRGRLTETVMNLTNTLILLMIVMLYVITGTSVGDDVIAALPDRTVFRGKRNGCVAIECAVTWNAAALPRILDTLSADGTKITFFVSGKWATNNAKTLDRIAADGHEVGTAGYAPHLDAGVETLTHDVETSVAIISEITGRAPTQYYSGLRDQTTSLRTAGALGLSHIACSTDLLSARGDPEALVARASDCLFDGSILLIQPTATAADALPALLQLIEQEGYSVVTVGEILQMRDSS